VGRWEEIHPEIWDTVVTPCDCCGQVVARRLWIVEVDNTERRFCSTRCEELYRTYVVGRTANATRSMSAAVQVPESSPSPFAEGAAYVDDRIGPIAEATISILDAGFSRSDVTYDVVAVWGGAFFRLDEHLGRFERSCRELRLDPGLGAERMAEILIDVVRASGLREAYVEMICTRGVSRHGARDPRTFENRFYAYAVPYVWLLGRDAFERGMDAVITASVRRIPAGSIDPTVKNFHWGDLTRGLFEAYDRDAHYPILLDGDGNVTEGAGYNVFAVEAGRLLTPAAGVLLGITRATVLELALDAGIPAEVCDMPAAVLRGADELFATSTAGGVMPITSLDGRPVGDGRPGPVTRSLHAAYWAAHERGAYLTPVTPRAS
jgi:branched-chain amino acid aminotransferase